jgi:hypothetical protein
MTCERLWLAPSTLLDFSPVGIAGFGRWFAVGESISLLSRLLTRKAA